MKSQTRPISSKPSLRYSSLGQSSRRREEGRSGPRLCSPTPGDDRLAEDATSKLSSVYALSVRRPSRRRARVRGDWYRPDGEVPPPTDSLRSSCAERAVAVFSSWSCSAIPLTRRARVLGAESSGVDGSDSLRRGGAHKQFLNLPPPSARKPSATSRLEFVGNRTLRWRGPRDPESLRPRGQWAAVASAR